MSEKPFWEGKTCEEMANLHVKVTFVAGAVLTGITDCSGHIRRSRNGSVVPISANRGAERFVPYRDIESIELLDDPEYERIDDINAVRKGDVFVANDGNRYPVMNVDLDSMDADGAGCAVRVNGSVHGSFWIRNSMLAYALRPKPQLPDHDGLWLDKGDGLWLVTGTTVIEIAPKDQPVASISYPASSIEASERLSLFAPFRPAKAVEA